MMKTYKGQNSQFLVVVEPIMAFLSKLHITCSSMREFLKFALFSRAAALVC